jgi:HAMP domain-containing protein
MSAMRGTAGQRKLRSVARQYAQAGYSVTIPAQGGDTPAFLNGLTPDLIAESEHDRVVVEIKESRGLRGSNELEEIAERVSREPGWRFELVAIPSAETAAAPAVKRMDYMADRARKAMGYGLPDAAFAYAWSIIEVLLVDLAARHGLAASRKPALHVARDLVSRGILSREALSEIEHARTLRKRIVHDETEVLPSAAEVNRLLDLGRRLREELTASAA